MGKFVPFWILLWLAFRTGFPVLFFALAIRRSINYISFHKIRRISISFFRLLSDTSHY